MSVLAEHGGSLEPSFFMAKKAKPVQKIFKMKAFKVKRSSLKMPKLPRISAKHIKL